MGLRIALPPSGLIVRPQTCRASKPLGVGHTGQGEIFRKWMRRDNRAIEQCQLNAQCVVAMLRQGHDEVLYRRAQTPRDLNAARAVLSDLAKTDMYEVFPIERP